MFFLKGNPKKRIGLGTWSWGNKIFWNYQTNNDGNLRDTFNESLKKGFDVIDTADSYGTGRFKGRSESLLGKFLLDIPPSKKKTYTNSNKDCPLSLETWR